MRPAGIPSKIIFDALTQISTNLICQFANKNVYLSILIFAKMNIGKMDASWKIAINNNSNNVAASSKDQV